MEPFDLINSPLEGTNLIEANAGTGKTYAITGLFLRLLLEKRLSVSEILVVTFTEAATEELKERIRGKLCEAEEILSGKHSGDPILGELLKKEKDSKAALLFIKHALRTFDNSAIFTIHGFCRRVLIEYAFESGSLFDTELIPDQVKLKTEVLEDFWRVHFYRASPLFVNYAMKSGFKPENMSSFVSNWQAQSYLNVIPRYKIQDASPEEGSFLESFENLKKAWTSGRKEIENILLNNEGLNRNRYSKTGIPEWTQAMDNYAASTGWQPVLFDSFKKFTSEEIGKGTKKNFKPPRHEFFDICQRHWEIDEALTRIFDHNLIALKVKLFHFVRDELGKRKEKRNVLFFDDLLLKLNGVLEGGGGASFSRAVRGQFKAALIDEFQDTDPVQYNIFKMIFYGGASPLFLIGDPKQAIYSFRGADIYTYLKASEDTRSNYTLQENWRSEPDFIKAVNTIFKHADRPFLYDKISYQKAVPANAIEHDYLKIDGRREPPLQLWFVDADQYGAPGKPVTKEKAREIISRAVAGEISGLLHPGRGGRVLLGRSPLKESDIAVLVRKNSEAVMMKDALSTLSIPGVLHSTGDLFDSREAIEMERILSALIEPGKDHRVITALATDALGLKGEELETLRSDEEKWDVWLIRLREYHNIWKELGFIRMFRKLVERENVLPRLMSYPDGERRCTNMLHIGEVLHQAGRDSMLDMRGLLKWLSERIEKQVPESEEHPLRLESDEKAVRIITIHKSKGLEYPVVFCPFMWDGSRMHDKKGPVAFHDTDKDMRLTLDFGTEYMQKNRLLAEEDQLAENLRLMYVAMTRARSRCYFIWGRFNGAETSAPSYLFYPASNTEEQGPAEKQGHIKENGNVVQGTANRFLALDNKAIRSDLNVLIEEAEGTIELTDIPSDKGRSLKAEASSKSALSYKIFKGTIDRKWRISSFSSILSNRDITHQGADRDEEYPLAGSEEFITKINEEGTEPEGIFAFPRGMRAGSFMHDLFEYMDFTNKDPLKLDMLIIDKLAEYGFDLEWEGTINSMIKKVLSASLDGDVPGFCLECIKNDDRINEVPFYFPLKQTTRDAIGDCFFRHSRGGIYSGMESNIERMELNPDEGFMKGFMDMVFKFRDRFYLVDWKSNYLGPSPDDYGQDGLATGMREGYYMLQYIIYTVALNQYLKLRAPGYDYEENFGGAYYIFVRGVDPDKGPDFGIYSDKPPKGLIDDLTESLITP